MGGTTTVMFCCETVEGGLASAHAARSTNRGECAFSRCATAWSSEPNTPRPANRDAIATPTPNRLETFMIAFLLTILSAAANRH
jgi:hypothetical protein